METSRMVQIFGFSQVLILVLIVGTVIVVFIKQWLRDQSLKNLNDPADGLATFEVARVKGRSKSAARQRPVSIESIFPEWNAATDPKVILGLSADCGRDEIEEAYKKLLKKFHPDRFASWGGDYQKRAHEVVLAIQRAREQMLKNTR